MAKLNFSLLFIPLFCTLIHFFPEKSIASDNITATQFLNGSQTLVSSGQIFELGFFNPQNSNSRYLGIWYKNIPGTAVWVANRDNPVVNSSGVLTFSKNGNLIIQNQTGHVFWSSNSSSGIKNPAAKLLDTGNLVLIDSEEYVWQSFDYPSDTLLPGMKLGWNLKTGLNWQLNSWKTTNDPSTGDYTYNVDPHGLPQLILRKGLTLEFRSGPWSGAQFSGGPTLMPNPVFKPIFVYDPDEVYYSYDVMDNITSRFVLAGNGEVQHFSWSHSNWNLLYTVQGDRCDNYGLCGDYGICEMENTANCECLSGFKPRSEQDWKVFQWSGGCVRKDLRICGSGEGFKKLESLKLPDASDYLVKESKSIEDCEEVCLKNCSCKAYAKLDVTGNGNSCVTWFGDLIDIRVVSAYGQDLYVRVASSELESSVKKKRVVTVAVLAVLATFFTAILTWFVLKKKRSGRARTLENEVIVNEVRTQENDLEMPLFEMDILVNATNDFCISSKIGEGGFGPVYKGQLPSGQEVAVKRLAESSGQGLQEFKNEVVLISHLQHRNLVKLLGCCIHMEERMLIYEYMPNKSLDYFLFDETRRSSLNWPKRWDIIIGVARGLLYLHRDSRLRIIHRDLKASNILLDHEMNPKISDFGMARIFGGDQTQTKTKRVVGTYGYMSPEYAIDGYFSLKSDVFSFGVILLELASGKKNRGFFHPDHQLNLLGHAWRLWNEGKALELVDPVLENQFPDSEALRCIQVGLLCVQLRPDERPTMSSVLLMLDNDNVTLARPGQPGFYSERSVSDSDSLAAGKMMSSSNEITVTLLEGR